MTHNIPTGAWPNGDLLPDEFDRAWRTGPQPRCEDYLIRVAEDQRPRLLAELLLLEFSYLQRSGTLPKMSDYTARFTAYRAVVEAAWQQFQALEGGTPSLPTGILPTDNTPGADREVTQSMPHGGLPPTVAHSGPLTTPDRIGRFQIRRSLGQGGFGSVFLAWDPQLEREVVLKIPRLDKHWTLEQRKQFAAEARTTARLRGPGIVTVFDVLEIDIVDRPSICVVQEYLPGTTLSDWLAQQTRPRNWDRCAELVAEIAEILSSAHQQQLFHRDLKPDNILLDPQGRVHVLDFGLALHVSERTQQTGLLVGTRPYMAPEQVRGESHRIDARTDVWALGVILYQVLTDRTPFTGNSVQALFEDIKYADSQPPRQLDPSIPVELERICVKCLAKPMNERYTTAHDLAFELRHWRDTREPRQEPAAISSPEPALAGEPARQRVAPKGLRSFDADDAGFFLDLLPGVRGRNGLPESIQFWKSRIEASDPTRAFAIGLLYGPSGCGKSSLVKAGLLPRLPRHIIAVYLEASADETERQLLAALRHAVPRLPATANLPEALAGVREGRWLSPGHKVLIVLDQFEQWLYGRRGQQTVALAEALRQCDGTQLQAILLVRDDFWMPISEFLSELDVRIVEGHNAGRISLFDVPHARRVLIEFGKAYGRLPADSTQFTPQNIRFLDDTVAGLAEDGKVICVRLSLFADMMKSREWTPASLAEVGGTAGVGATFLEEIFSSRTAPPQHRQHQVAARSVLQALLPDTGTEIKGHRRSRAELLQVSGYASRPRDFAELIHILDRDVRLITPVGEEKDNGPRDDAGASRPSSAVAHTSHFQLTHDYLVPSLRDWLTRKQRETRRGRAELRLEERAATWNAKPENRYLPSPWEYLSIRVLTDARHWSGAQRALMAQATRYHLSRMASTMLVVVLLIGAALWSRHQMEQNRRALLAQKAAEQEATRIEGLVGRLISAEPNQLPDIIQELNAHPELAATYLSPLLSRSGEESTPDEKRAQLHARLATVSRDPSLIEPLVEELLTGKVTYVLPIRHQLRPAAASLTERFRTLLREKRSEPQRRFRAALALAEYTPESQVDSWFESDRHFVAAQLVSSNPEFQPLLRDALRPIRGILLADLERIFGDPQATDAQRLGAANALADYAASEVPTLARLLAVATPEQHSVLYPLVVTNRTPAVTAVLGDLAATAPPDDLGSVERISFGQRRANAAVTLLRLGEREAVLPVFEMSDDPEALTQFIFRCRPRGVHVENLLACLPLVTAAPPDRFPRNTRYALLLALGEYELEEIAEGQRTALLKQLAEWYANDPSSGVHGAAGWLLRRWGQARTANEIDRTAVPYSPEREWFRLAIEVTPKSTSTTGARPTGAPKKTFYFTFVVFPAGHYTVGSVADEPDRKKADADQHRVTLTRPFAMLDREITFEELLAFSPQYLGFMQQYEAQPADAGFAVHWYDSVRFCRWLGQQSGLPESEQAYAAPESLDQVQYPREPNPTANWAPRDWPVELARRGFRLPTDAEWEIAARGGCRTSYGHGSDVGLLDRFGWFIANSGKRVHRQKELCPSIRGLFDLHGNVFEWTHDWYEAIGRDAVTDPRGPQGGSNRMNRGGSWGLDATLCRASCRSPYSPTLRVNGGGFRLALSPSVALPGASPDKQE